MVISIIIPTYNESLIIENTILHLQKIIPPSNCEIIISDGGSTDDTLQIAEKLGVVAVLSPVKGRAGQMNFGVQKASGEMYFFLHADSLPSTDCYISLQKAFAQGYNCGSFRTKFDSDSFLLKVNAFFTRFNYLFFRGGDQGIFVTKALWERVGSYKEQMFIMEDYDFIARIWEQGKFKLIPKATMVSARKYTDNTWLTVQLANLKIVRMYKKGASQTDMVTTYKHLLNYRKNAF